ncbi:MAG: hypothetical protein ACKO7R_17705 [Pseudanabaena sp.]
MLIVKTFGQYVFQPRMSKKSKMTGIKEFALSTMLNLPEMPKEAYFFDIPNLRSPKFIIRYSQQVDLNSNQKDSF